MGTCMRVMLLIAAYAVPLAAAFLLMMASAIAAGPRHAVVVGNSQYEFAPLANPGNDANDVARALAEAGFEVKLILDAGKAQIEEAVAEMRAELAGETEGVGLFFFAGHGVQNDGENWLLPVDAEVADIASLQFGAVNATEIVNRMSSAGNGLNIIILDACRNNPLTGDVSGLSRIESSASLFVSYSTAPGEVALDGSGRNSPYTKHLTLALATPGLNLEETFKRTLKGVYQETGGEQIPFLSSSFFGEFVFRPGKTLAGGAQNDAAEDTVASAARLTSLRPADPAKAEAALNGVYVSQGTNPDGSRYRGMATVREDGGRYQVKWWIAGRVFNGVGERAGKMLIVNWGDKHPVVYGFGPNGLLDGEWADGTATDRLTPFALADGSAKPREGRHRTEGRNPDGSQYRGTLDIRKQDEVYLLNWRVAGSTYSGRGRLEDGLLVVDWGSSEPIIYALRDDGTLVGLWQSGRGSEVSKPQ